ncbi:hypothetical protein KDL45_05845 [bacterium]|nr:hypothetical protein [bacterium]
MREKFLLLMMVLLLSALFAVPAFASGDDDDDDDTADDDTVDDDVADDDVADDDDDDDDDDNGSDFDAALEFNAPTALDPDFSYQFTFSVTNNSAPSASERNWIYLVEVFMPSLDYKISSGIFEPESSHGGAWDAMSLEDESGVPGIQWIHTAMTSTSGAIGDIEEGDFLTFSFEATTDSQATDGFEWRLLSDNDDSVVTGTSYIGEGDDDDDDDTEPVGDDDDDDDDDGGCGF